MILLDRCDPDLYVTVLRVPYRTMPGRSIFLYPRTANTTVRSAAQTDWRSRNNMRHDWRYKPTFVQLTARPSPLIARDFPVNALRSTVPFQYALPNCRVLEQTEPGVASPAGTGCDSRLLAFRFAAGHCTPVNVPSRQPSAASLCGSTFHPEFFQKKPVGMNQCWQGTDGIGLSLSRMLRSSAVRPKKRTHFCGCSLDCDVFSAHM